MDVITNEQRAEIGASDNNAPPVLKIYWKDNKVRVLRKVLKNVNTPYPDILHKDAWTDERRWFNRFVNNDKFTLEVLVEENSMTIVLDDNEKMVFDDVHIEKWGVFENYFKAGNYLQTTDKNAFAKVKYYDLKVSH